MGGAQDRCVPEKCSVKRLAHPEYFLEHFLDGRAPGNTFGMLCLRHFGASTPEVRLWNAMPHDFLEQSQNISGKLTNHLRMT